MHCRIAVQVTGGIFFPLGSPMLPSYKLEAPAHFRKAGKSLLSWQGLRCWPRLLPASPSWLWVSISWLGRRPWASVPPPHSGGSPRALPLQRLGSRLRLTLGLLFVLPVRAGRPLHWGRGEEAEPGKVGGGSTGKWIARLGSQQLLVLIFSDQPPFQEQGGV